MKFLIDTHTFLWFVNNSPQLSPVASGIIANYGNEVYLSLVSVWEISIKVSTGKLSLAQPVDIFIPDQL